MYFLYTVLGLTAYFSVSVVFLCVHFFLKQKCFVDDDEGMKLLLSWPVYGFFVIREALKERRERSLNRQREIEVRRSEIDQRLDNIQSMAEELQVRWEARRRERDRVRRLFNSHRRALEDHLRYLNELEESFPRIRRRRTRRPRSEPVEASTNPLEEEFFRREG